MSEHLRISSQTQVIFGYRFNYLNIFFFISFLIFVLFVLCLFWSMFCLFVFCTVICLQIAESYYVDSWARLLSSCYQHWINAQNEMLKTPRRLQFERTRQKGNPTIVMLNIGLIAWVHRLTISWCIGNLLQARHCINLLSPRPSFCFSIRHLMLSFIRGFCWVDKNLFGGGGVSSTKKASHEV